MAVWFAPLAWNVARQGVMWAGKKLAQRAAQNAIQQAPAAATAAGVVAGGNAAINQMTNGATEDADQTLSETDATTACAECEAREACAHLAGGNPASPYRGGAFGALPTVPGRHRHHTPSKASSPLPEAMGPSVQMDIGDHLQTASHPASGEDFIAHIAAQRAVMASGGGVTGAAMLDVRDIQSKFGNKYDDAIGQMLAYANCLDQHGAVP